MSTLEVGDLCTIWSGEGKIVQPQHWVLGFVVAQKKHKFLEKLGYQVLWMSEGCLGERDYVWYTYEEIAMENLINRFGGPEAMAQGGQ